MLTNGTEDLPIHQKNKAPWVPVRAGVHLDSLSSSNRGLAVRMRQEIRGLVVIDGVAPYDMGNRVNLKGTRCWRSQKYSDGSWATEGLI